MIANSISVLLAKCLWPDQEQKQPPALACDPAPELTAALLRRACRPSSRSTSASQRRTPCSWSRRSSPPKTPGRRWSIPWISDGAVRVCAAVGTQSVCVWRCSAAAGQAGCAPVYRAAVERRPLCVHPKLMELLSIFSSSSPTREHSQPSAGRCVQISSHSPLILKLAVAFSRRLALGPENKNKSSSIRYTPANQAPIDVGCVSHAVGSLNASVPHCPIRPAGFFPCIFDHF